MLSRWLQTSLQRLFLVQVPGSRNLVTVLVNGVVTAVSGLLISRVLGMFAQVLIIQRLGLLHNGEYTNLTVLLSLFASLLGLGLDTWLLQEGGRDPENLTYYMRQVLGLKAIASSILFVVLAVIWSSRMTEASAFVIGAFGAMVESFAQTGYSAMRVRHENTRAAILQTIAPLLLVGILVLLQRNDLSVMLLISIQAAISTIVGGIVIRRMWQIRAQAKPQSLQIIQVIKSSWLFIAGEVLANLYAQSGLLLLNVSLGTAAVGLFSPARNLIFLTYLIPNLLFAVSLPLLMTPRLAQREYLRILKMMMAFSMAYGIAVLIVLLFFGQSIIHIYGSEYDAALPYVQIMAIIPLLKSFSFVWVAILLSHLAQRLRVIIQASTVLVSIVVGMILIPKFGLAGTAWQAVAIELFLFAVYGLGAWYMYRRAQR